MELSKGGVAIGGRSFFVDTKGGGVGRGWGEMDRDDSVYGVGHIKESMSARGEVFGGLGSWFSVVLHPSLPSTQTIPGSSSFSAMPRRVTFVLCG